MNKRLDEALMKVRALSDKEQQAAADLLLDFVEGTKAGTWPSPEQIAEIEAVLKENDYATDEEVEAFFAQFKK